MPDANEVAKAALDAEKKALGLGSATKPNKADKSDSELDEEGEDMGDLEDDAEKGDDKEEEHDSEDDEEEEEEDESEDSEEDSDEEDEEEDEDDSEKDQSHKKRKGISYQQFNSLKKDLRSANKKLADALKNNEELQSKLPDDFQERVDAFAKELGVQDPENLKKIIKFVKETAVDKNTKNLEQKLNNLEKELAETKSASVVDEFPNEWKSFETDFFSKEFPNATDEQKKTAREVMKKLSHTRNVGGKPYIDEKTGKEVLDPYPLDYVFYNNKDKFAELVTQKKKKGMETARTQGITPEKEDKGEVKHLSEKSSSSDIRKLDKKYSEMEAGQFDSLRSPENSTI